MRSIAREEEEEEEKGQEEKELSNKFPVLPSRQDSGG